MEARLPERFGMTSERLIALLRSIFLLAVLAIVKASAHSFYPVMAVNVDILALAGVVYILLSTFLQHHDNSLLGKRVFLVLDFAFITLIVLRTGGFQSNFALLYLLPIVQSSVRHRIRDAAITAAAACLMQIYLAVSQGLNTQIVTPMYWKATIYVALSAFLWFFLVQLARESRSHQRRVSELTSLVQLTSALTSSLDIDETAEESLDIILPLFGASIGAVSLVGNDNNLITRASRGLSESNWSAVRKLTREILDSETDDVATRELTMARPDEQADDSISLLFAPLLVREKMIGVLSLGKEKPLPWDYPEMALMRTIADRMAAYVDTANLYNETKRLAITDDMTETYNHRYFQSRIGQEIKRADRYSRSLSLIMVDIDYFKKYNDTHGHPMGDEILRGVASILKSWTRTVDVVSRYGGDEFTILLPETDEEGALILARRLKKKIEETYFPFESSQPSGSISVSIGIASFPETAMSAKDLLKNADDAMYHAKTKRNTISCAASQLNDVDGLMMQLSRKWDRT